MSHERQRDEERIVTAMAEMMREKLARRRHHGPWVGLPMDRRADLLRDEIAELAESIALYDSSDPATHAAILDELTDVACCCAIVADLFAEEAL